MVSYSIQEVGPQDRLDFQQLRLFAARWWRLIAATTLVFAVAAFIVCLGITPTYVATTQILLDPPRKQVLDKDRASASDTLDSSVVDSQVYLILSSETLSRVVTNDKLEQDPEFGGAAPPSLLGRIFGFLQRSGPAEDMSHADNEIDSRQIPSILRLYQAADALRVGKSNVISVSVSAHGPRKAMKLANDIARTYLDSQVEARVKNSRQMSEQFQDRLQALSDQVHTSEMAVADFRKKYGLTTTADEKIVASDQELTSLNDKLTAAASDTADKRAKYDQAKPFLQGSGDASALGDIVRSPAINQLRGQQAELMRRSADLAQTFGPSHPVFRQLAAQKAAINAALKAEQMRLLTALKNDYEVALARENAIRAMTAEISDPGQASGDIGVRLRELERTNSANKVLFESFLNQAKLTNERPGFETPDARIISPALEPLRPSSPKVSLIVAVAALVGAMFGVGLAAVLSSRRDRRSDKVSGVIPA